jgi:hypothetical protein
MSQELVKIIIEYTVFGVLGFLVSQRKTFFKWITNLAESHSKLNSHDLFNIINDKRVNTIKYIKFQSSPNKTRIIIDFLDIKLRVIEEKTLLFVNDKSKTNLKDQELFNACTNLFLDIVQTHNDEWELFFKEKGLEQETIDYIMFTFNRWHKDTVDSIQLRLNSIFKGGFYDTSYQKVLAMLEVFSFAIDTTCKDGVKSFEEMNGKLDKINYK